MIIYVVKLYELINEYLKFQLKLFISFIHKPQGQIP